MPVYPMSAAVAPAEEEKFVAALASEIPKQGTTGEPLIFENPIQSTDKLYVIVIWSEWEGIPAGSVRTRIIMEAYRRADTAKHARIAIAAGITWEEADTRGFFPYSIASLARESEAQPDSLRQAMIAEGAFDTPSGVKLKFFVLDQALSALQRLHIAVPNGHWQIVHRTPSSA